MADDRATTFSLPEDEPQALPWSKKAVRRTGEALVAGRAPKGNAPSFEDVAIWYEEIKGLVQAVIYVEDWPIILGIDHEPNIAARVKSDDTLREKLIREQRFPLPQIQDVAGVRFEADMRLDQQDQAVHYIVGLFTSRGWKADVKDYRDGGGSSGYRAVHVRLARQDGARAEVQVRTKLQGWWANVYERLADQFGRHIRYGGLPNDPRNREIVLDWQRESVELVELSEQTQMEVHEHGSAEHRERADQLRRATIDTLRRVHDHRAWQVDRLP